MVIEDLGLAKLAGLRSDFASIAEACRPFDKLDALVGKGRRSVEDALRQFESPMIVTVSMGMLKAGKSTLTNLMARTPDASPVGYGVDTTLRPALILMAKEGEKPGLVLFFDNAEQTGENPGESAQERRERLMSAILDRLRGLPAEDARGELREMPLPLTQENLRKSLCARVGSNALLPREPLLAVVRVPYNPEARMLRNHRMLMDMPGLDSNNSGMGMEQYQAVISQCDMMLFVQSSVAPLNAQACRCLNEISSVRQAATAWIILNRMKSRPWLQDAALLRADEEQLRHAQDTVCKESGQSPCELHWASANLGMAFDALLGNPSERGEGVSPESLFAESSYRELEDALVDDLERNGESIRYQHCCDVLLSRCQAMSLKLGEYAEALASAHQEADERDTALRRVDKNLQRELAAPLDWVVPPIGLADSLEGEFAAAFEREKGKFAALKVYGSKVPGSLIDKYLNSCAEAGRTLSARMLGEISLSRLRAGGSSLDESCNMVLQRELKDVRSHAEWSLPAPCKEEILEEWEGVPLARVDGDAPLGMGIPKGHEDSFLMLPKSAYKKYGLSFSGRFWEKCIEINQRSVWAEVLEDMARRCAQKVAETVGRCAEHKAKEAILGQKREFIQSVRGRIDGLLADNRQKAADFAREQGIVADVGKKLKGILHAVREMKQN